MSWAGSAAADICVVSMLTEGMLLLAASGFGISSPIMIFAAAAMLCAACCTAFETKWCSSHRMLTLVFAVVLYLLVLFICQEKFFSGAAGFAGLVSDTLGRVYSGQGTAHLSGQEYGDAGFFVCAVFVPVIVWLAAAVLWVRQMIMVYICIFPAVALLAICGAAGNVLGLFLIMTGIVTCHALLGIRRQGRMWGGTNAPLVERNRRRFNAVSVRSFVLAFAACAFLSVPGYFIARPALSLSLKPLHEVSVRIQSSFINKAMEVLPELTAGRLNLETEAVGSGVTDGQIGSDEGYLLSNVDDLSVSIDAKPVETIFLRGFVGAGYSDGQWNQPYGSTFDGAALSWKTDGAARLYIQNLAFLRTAYAAEQSGDVPEVSPVEMTVERINANEKYTFVPYGVYLNDYYTVDGGDGAISGQTENEDRYYFYFREDLTNALESWNELDDTSSVMDRTEGAYRAYCISYSSLDDIDIAGGVSDSPDLEAAISSVEAGEKTEAELVGEYEAAVSDMQSLAELTSLVMSLNKWSGSGDAEAISAWIREYLADNYVYDKEPGTDYGDSDALEYFLFDSKKGNSVQFASAAVLLYRMFDVPSRYVVGYELTKEMFSAQPDGTYEAVAEGENSQAWAEIYVDGIGWMPKDMTPGIIGTYEETGGKGELIEPATEDSGDDADRAADDSSLDDDDADTRTHASGNMSVGQFIKYVGCILAVLVVIFAALYGGGRLCVCLGYSPLGRRSRKQRLIGVFCALYGRARHIGLPDGVTSQDEEFVAFCEDRLREKDSEAAGQVRAAVGRLYEVCYGGEQAEEADIEQMRGLLKAVMKLRKAA